MCLELLLLPSPSRMLGMYVHAVLLVKSSGSTAAQRGECMTRVSMLHSNARSTELNHRDAYLQSICAPPLQKVPRTCMLEAWDVRKKV